MELNLIIRCPICGALYQTAGHYCGDQSKCPACKHEEKRRMEQPTPQEELEQVIRRNKFFGA